MCQLSVGTIGSSSCSCKGKYVISKCDVIHNADNSCKVLSEYNYAGVCNNKTVVPTPAPSTPKICPNKDCHGQNSILVRKLKGKCDSTILNKFCLKSKLTAKLNADLECDIESKCYCNGKYRLGRCFSVPVRSQSSLLAAFNPFCYYFAKYVYDGTCSAEYTYTGGTIVDGRVHLP